MRRHVAGALTLFVFGLGLQGSIRADDVSSSGEDVAKSFWKRVLDYPIDPKQIPRSNEATLFWGDVAVGIPDVLEDFWPKLRGLDRSEQKKAVEYFVVQFGKHGAEADFRWFLSGLTFVYPDSTDYSRHPADLYEFGLIVDEALTRRMIKEPELLDRFVYLTAWLDHLFNPLVFAIRVSTLRDGSGFPEEEDGKPGSDYWSDAWRFLLMAHVTGRGDLARNADPEKLDDRFRVWLSWWLENGAYLEPVKDKPKWRLNERAKEAGQPLTPEFDRWGKMAPLQFVPKVPFPDWDKTVPPPNPRVFLELI